MISQLWRERLTYFAMSAFVAWHTAATLIAPAPDNSVMVQSLRPVFQPYLTLFRLDNPWDFFAPTVGKGSQFRYVIEDAAGKKHTFVPAEGLSWYHPSYFWLRSWYYAIIENPGLYAESAANLLCKEHAALNPVSITLLDVEEGDFLRHDQLEGKSPMDAEFITVNTVLKAPCKGS